MIQNRLAALAAFILAVALQTATAQTRVPAKVIKSTPDDTAKESAAMATDGYKWTKWCVQRTGKLPYFVVLDAGKSITLDSYGLVTGDDTHDYPSRNPSDWILLGSNDNQKWDVCNIVKRDRKMSDENEQEYTFPVKDAKPYRYYQFVFTALNDGVCLQLSEINLYTK